MTYTIIEILEDIEVGCEERAEGEGPKAIAILRSEEGDERSFRMDDALFYVRGLEEGSRVCFDEDGLLVKAIAKEDSHVLPD